MPDVSMCSGNHCTLKNKCYRYRAIPNPHRQSYSSFKQKSDKTCDNFWDIENRTDLTPINEEK